MNKINLVLVSVMVIGFLSNGVIACMSDMECHGQGQEKCVSEDNHYYIQSYSCNDGVCEKEILRVVDNCDDGITVGYESGIICSPNSLSCDDSQMNVLKCNGDGNNKFIFKECIDGCGYNHGKANCNSNIIRNLKNENDIKNNIFLSLFILALLIIGILYLKKLSKNRKSHLNEVAVVEQ